MARLRVRFRFNPGRTGAPMDKLGEFASQTEKFLRALARDIGVPARKGDWLASDFGNESVSFDSEYAGAVSDLVADRGNEVLELVADGQALTACERGLIDFETAAEFGQIGKSLDPDERFYVGTYRNGGEPNWHEVTYKSIAELHEMLAAPLVSVGAVQGVIHSWATGAEPHFFQLRELATGGLVRCVYADKMHEKILQAHARQDKTVVHVYGEIRWDRAKNHIIELKANDLELTQPITAAQFDRLFGSMPEFTGDMSTDEYIDWIRGSGDD